MFCLLVFYKFLFILFSRHKKEHFEYFIKNILLILLNFFADRKGILKIPPVQRGQKVNDFNFFFWF